MMSLFNTLKVTIVYLTMTIYACFGVTFLLTPSIPLIFFNRRLYFRWCSIAMSYYLLMVTVCFVYL